MTDLIDERQISRALQGAGLRYVQDLNPQLAEQLSHWLNALLSQPHNLTAIRDPEEAIIRHVIEPLRGRHLLIEADIPVPHGPLIEIGSGNGAPGLPFALCEPDRKATLLDARSGSIRFLRSVLDQLATERVSVHQQRAELAAHTDLRERFALALTRAAAPPVAALELTVPFLQVGGIAMLWTGPLKPDVNASLNAAANVLGADPTPLDPPRDIAVFTKIRPCTPGHPRPWPQIRRRPLG